MTNLFGHSVRSESVLLYLSEAALCFVAVYLLLFGQVLPSTSSTGREVVLAALLTLATGMAAGATGMHNPATWTRTGRIAAGMFLAALLLLPVAGAAAVLSGVQDPGSIADLTLRLVGVGIGAAVLARVIFFLLFCIGQARLFIQPIALVGASDGVLSGAVGQGVAVWPHDPYRVALHLRTREGGNGHEMDPAALRARRIHLVVAAGDTSQTDPLLGDLRQAGLRVLGEAEFLEHQTGRVDLATLSPEWLRTARAMERRPVEAAVRRGFDIVVSLALLLFTLPLTLLAVIAIRLDSPGPAFYRQERVGLGGRTFSLMKLRSMRTDAEGAGAPQWATQKDPRVTRVGRFLRLTRIDEIPQVLNVLRGDMAFIGPRPERPVFVETLGHAIPHYHDRAVVKPGITGWAQVNFPYGASVEDARQKLSYDLYYVRRRSLFLDLLILLGTVRVVLFQEGSR